MSKRVKSKKNVKSRKTTKKVYEKNNRILYLLFLLLLTGILLSTTSYAWFTTNRVVTVDTLNVKVKAAGGIEISADGNEWKAMIDKADLTGVHDTTYTTSVNQLPDYIEPVSTGGGVDNGKLIMYYGVVTNDASGNFILTSSRNTEVEGNGIDSDGKFIAFDLFLKTTEGKDIYLTGDSNVTYNGEASYGIENAVRVAFVVEGTSDAGNGAATFQGLSTTSDNNVYIWEPNYDVHTLDGVSNALHVYNINVGTTGGNILPYDGVINDIAENNKIYLSDAKASKYPNLFKTVEVDISTVSGFTNNVSLFNLGAGVTKIRVYLWVEGQDVDCENNASVGDISFNLQFTTNPS